MPEALWTADEIARAVDGQVEGGFFAANGVSIDTRSLEPGDLFVALAGARDGHEFLEAAFGSGATGALVSRPSSRPCVRVDDTFAALEALGRAARDRAPQTRRAAVTGSVGKTSVTQAIAAGLRLAGRAHSSVKSYNNHIGVPLTLARMPRDTERAVFEIGMNHAGEIGPLSRQVRPHAALVTVVGPVHVENFPDGETGVAKAKAEIFEGLAPGGVAVLNADDKWFDLLAAAARASGARIVTFGAKAGCDAGLEGFAPSGDGAVVGARLHGRELSFRIGQTGAHWGPNSLAALLMLEALDVPLETALEGLKEFAPLEGRGALRSVETDHGPFTLIDESYNANPLSMQAALAALAARPTRGRRIAVLTDMLELGPEAPLRHAELLGPIEAAGVDMVFCAGPLMHSLWSVLPPARRGAWTETAAELAPLVHAVVRAGDVVMVKGSNGSQASTVVKALIHSAQSASAGEGR
ncbi:MAG TPA: UDP-N-acetylmuramoyl-tripeptide--D-alanyl-D-alanine ligase [Caulobacteraceae bacterium]|jgi:UDP-N-acetylmuramoyl-tripeptide--D-alanyl-D-alanine ligase|nr:UDP-N-acetylmuramoyl-tripeptide--D-alanyl-D-alanine ligase [Caulobacteraceae bacterium]